MRLNEPFKTELRLTKRCGHRVWLTKVTVVGQKPRIKPNKGTERAGFEQKFISSFFRSVT